MRKLLSIIALFAFINVGFCQNEEKGWELANLTKKASLTVMYFENHPFYFINNEGNLAGIEIDILKDFAVWCKSEKGIDISFDFEPSQNFAKFYDNLKSSNVNTIGLGSLAISESRQSEITFTPPYMKNKSVLVSSLEIPTTRNFDEFETNFYDLTAVVISGSSHEAVMLNIKNKYFPRLRVRYIDTPTELLQLVFEDKNYYGYVDLLSYWSFIQRRCCTLKIHRDIIIQPDYFAFGMSKNSDWNDPFTEFFEGGFGYISKEKYLKILEKYLGYEIIKSVELY